MTQTETLLQAHRAAFAAHDAGNVETFLHYLHPDGSLFHTNNDLLIPLAHDTSRAAYSAGYGGQLSIHHAEAKVFGDCAVLTCYLSGLFRWAGSGGAQGTWRYSSMWVKEDERWQIVHTHISPLAPIHTSE